MLIDALSAYVPHDRLVALASGATLPDRAAGSVLFADLSGFTRLTDALSRAYGPQRGAEELTRQLNAIYTELIGEVEAFRGSVMAFSGDAITCFFDQDSGLRAVTCALWMQQVMRQQHRAVRVADEEVALAVKIAITAGAVRRFQVGDPSIQLIDALAGDPLARLAAAEHCAEKGEIVVGEEIVAAIGEQIVVLEWRHDEDRRPIAVVSGPREPILPDPWPPLASESLAEATLRPWVLPAVYQRLKERGDVFLAELRPAAVLFASFRGIDYQSEAAGGQLDSYIRWCQRIINRYEGALLQLTIGDKGSYFYATFGAPQAHADDADRAARAAYDLSHIPPELSAISDVRIGVSLGRMRTGAYGAVRRRTYGVIGHEVNMAARLMQAAGPGQVFASEYIHTPTASDFQWQNLPPLHVKGRDEPIHAFCLIGPVLRQAADRPTSDTPMIGRRQELRQIGERIDAVVQGRGALITISGEAGMGKSRLVTEALRLVQTYELPIYVGEGQYFGVNDSYLIWRNIWRDLFALPNGEPPEVQIAALQGQLARLDPSLLPRLPLLASVVDLTIADNPLTASFDAKLRKESLEALLVRCVELVAAERPLILVLEDSHWCDPLSRDLITAISRVIADLPVLIIVAFRPDEAGHAFDRQLMSLPHSLNIVLAELNNEMAASLVELRYQHGLRLPERSMRLPAAVISWLVERTQGNPFYIEELISYLHGFNIPLNEVRTLEQLDLPTSLASLVLSRIDQLSESQKTTLKVASVIGRFFPAAWLWGFYPALGQQLSVRADLEVLIRLDLTVIDESGPDLTYLFKHILTHGVAYDSLPFETRSWLHGQLASFIEATYPQERERFVDLLAFHYDRSTDLEKRRFYLRVAGERAQASFANTAAIDYFQRLLPLIGEDERGAIEYRLGQVFEVVGEWDAADHAYAQALALAQRADERPAITVAQRAIGRLLRKRGDLAEALTWLERARDGFAALSDVPGLVQTLADLGEAHRQQGAFGPAAECYREGLRLSAAADDRDELAARSLILKSAGTLAAVQGDYPEAQRQYDEALRLRRQLGERQGVAEILNNLGMVAMYTEQYPLARSLFAEALEIFREIGDRYASAYLLNNSGMIERYLGEYESARTLFTESVAIRRTLGDRWGIANALNSLTNLLLSIGEYAIVEPLLRESLEINVEIGDRAAIAYCLEDFAGLAAAQGAAQRALLLVGAAAALRDVIGAPLHPSDQAALDAALAPAIAKIGDPEKCAILNTVGRNLPVEAAVDLAMGLMVA